MAVLGRGNCSDKQLLAIGINTSEAGVIPNGIIQSAVHVCMALGINASYKETGYSQTQGIP